MPAVQGIQETASLLAKYAPKTPTPPAGSLLSLMSKYSVMGQREVISATDMSLRAQIAREAGRLERPDPEGVFSTGLNWLLTPQKAIFAGIYDLRTGKDIGTALESVAGEFITGLTSGTFDKDVQFSDILDPYNPTGVRPKQMQALGFLGDLTVDPLMLVPGKVLAAPFVGAAKLAKWGYGSFKTIPKAGPLAEKAVSMFRKTFISSMAESPMGVKAEELLKGASRMIERYRADLLDEGRESAIALSTFAKEAGIPIEELRPLITKHLEMTKLETQARFLTAPGGAKGFTKSFIETPKGTMAITEPLEDTLISVYKEYGVAGFDQFTEDSVARLFMDQKPIRQAVLWDKFKDLEKTLIKQVGEPNAKRISDMVVELKDKNLERFIWEGKGRVKPTGERLNLFSSMEKDYVALALTQDAQKILNNFGFGKITSYGFEFNPNITADMHSVFQKMGITKANELSRAGKLRIGDRTMEVAFQMFEEDPIIIDTLRTYYSKRAIENTKVLQDLVEGYGAKLSEIAPGGKKLVIKTKGGKWNTTTAGKKYLDASDHIRLEIKGFENTSLPREVSNLVQNYYRKTGDPDALVSFARGITKVQNVWKAWTIFPFPEFHFRNMIGNQWNMILGGMSPVMLPKWAAHSLWVQSGNLDKGITSRLGKIVEHVMPKDDMLTLGKKAYSRTELLDLMEKQGILRTGFYGGQELPTMMRKSIARAERGASGIKGKALNLVDYSVEGNPILRMGMNVAGGIEDNGRGAMFLWALDQGMTPDQAQKTVFKHLFDYSDLTEVEQRVFRGVLFPFYAWSRKNIPLQLEYLVKDPTKFSALQKMKQSLETDIVAGEAPDERYLAEYIRKGFKFRLRKTPAGEFEYFVLNNWIPSADLSDVDSIEKIFKKLPMEQLGPVPKTVIEQLTDTITFYERDFQEGKKSFAGLRLTDRKLSLLRNIRILSVIDRFTRESAPGLGLNLTRLLTGAGIRKQNVERGARFFANRRRKTLQEINRAIRLAMEAGQPDEAQALLRKRNEYITGERDI